MPKKYITLRKLNKKTGKKEGPILFAEVKILTHFIRMHGEKKQ